MSKLRWTFIALIWWATSPTFAFTPGPTPIIQCPGSEELASYPTAGSGNTFGKQIWSDGFTSYPMLPIDPLVARCGDAGDFFWLADAKRIGAIEAFPLIGTRTPKAWFQAKSVQFPHDGDINEAVIRRLGTDHGKEIYLRTFTWRLANSIVTERRRSEPAASALLPDSAARANVRRLVAVLNADDPNERLLKAEALRELGQFDDATQVLQLPFPPELEAARRWIRELVDQGDVMVRKMPNTF